jgi:small GTP-binding protein
VEIWKRLREALPRLLPNNSASRTADRKPEGDSQPPPALESLRDRSVDTWNRVRETSSGLVSKHVVGRLADHKPGVDAQLARARDKVRDLSTEVGKRLHETSSRLVSKRLPGQSPPPGPGGDSHLALARESLRELLTDERIPDEVREALGDDYAQVQDMLDKLEFGHVHIAVFGRVSVGKTALVNALLGEQRFSTSPLHGETRSIQSGNWQEFRDGNVFLIDTPGINEVEGEAREQLAREVAGRADLVLFVVDGDLTDSELSALRSLAATGRPLLLVLNKIDRYHGEDREHLIEALQHHTANLLHPDNLVTTAASPGLQWVIRVDAAGNETEEQRQPAPDVDRLKTRLWQGLEEDGNTLVALNASLFAGQLSDQVATRVLAARRTLGEKVIRTWCIAKGVAVALNPVPVADLVAAAVVDVSMVVHLSRVYGLPLSRAEAGKLTKTIGAQMLLLMGTVWAVHLIASALKLGTGGLSAIVTGGAQGAVAYYSTFVVGRAAEQYLANGKSWGDAGPKLAVREILNSVDRDSIIEQAKADIRARLSTGKAHS